MGGDREKRPEQLKMTFALWSRCAVLQLIEQEAARGRLAGPLQKPIKKAYEQRPEVVQKWLDEEYPAIEKRAKAEGGERGTKRHW